MKIMVAVHVFSLVISFGLTGCVDPREDPCQLLTVQEMRSLDETIATSLWAGRDGETKDDEVCAFYTSNGDPRAMLFVWYDKERDPMELATLAATATNGQVEEVSEIGTIAAAYFQGKELEFLVAKSNQGVIGLRTKQSVKRGSKEFDQLASLTNQALLRKQ